jgi:hypothetical protein
MQHASSKVFSLDPWLGVERRKEKNCNYLTYWQPGIQASSFNTVPRRQYQSNRYKTWYYYSTSVKFHRSLTQKNYPLYDSSIQWDIKCCSCLKKNQLIFRKKILPPSSGLKSKPSKRISKEEVPNRTAVKNNHNCVH